MSTNQYAPIVHTGFANTYSPEQIRDFVSWCVETGYAGFSVEGKAYPATNDIEGWASGFLRCLHAAAEEARKKGLDVWIFDEWGYPSGTAAGKTLEGHPEYRCKSLYIAADYFLNEGETLSISVPDHFIAASAWPVARDRAGQPIAEPVAVRPDESNRLTYTAVNRRERFCAVCYAYDGHQANGIFVPDPTSDAQGNLDTLSHEGTRRYIDMMHERYAKAMPEQFGRAIKGFFYDEPFMPFPFPYTFDILDEFRRKKGYDLTPRLALMIAGLDRDARRDYRDVVTARMAEAFFGQLADWCHAHGLELVGHQDLDHDVRSLDTVSGNFFRNNVKNDSPGVDYIWDQLQPGRFADHPRFAGSAKHILGKKHALSESFAATGRCMYPDYMRWAMEHQMIRGIDRFYLMIADPDLEGDAFESPISAKHPYSKHFARLVNERVAATNRLLSENSACASVGLYVPMRDISDAYPPIQANRVSLHMPWEWVNDTAKALTYAPVDFDYIWDEALERMPLQDGAFVTPAGQRISTVVIPGVERLPEATLQRLLAFGEAGGKIACVSSMPIGLIGKAEVAVSPEEIAGILTPEIDVQRPSMLALTIRNAPEGKLFFVLNEDYKPYESAVAIPGEGALCEYDYATGAWQNVSGPIGRFEAMQLRLFRRGAAGEDPYRLCGEPIQIEGWTAETPAGAVDLADGLRDWRSFVDPTYTGFVTYAASFSAPADGMYRLSLGCVCYSAIVTLDGDEFKLPFAPYSAPVHLAKGEHSIKVSVLNTDVNTKLGSVEAERRAMEIENQHLRRKYENTRYTNDRRYVKSGLIGPVCVTPISK